MYYVIRTCRTFGWVKHTHMPNTKIVSSPFLYTLSLSIHLTLNTRMRVGCIHSLLPLVVVVLVLLVWHCPFSCNVVSGVLCETYSFAENCLTLKVINFKYFFCHTCSIPLDAFQQHPTRTLGPLYTPLPFTLPPSGL